MSDQSKAIHSIIFTSGAESFNTWDTWHLIPSSRPVVAQPTPQYKGVDIPGRNGQLDITTYLTGVVTYSDRQGSWEFIVANGYQPWQQLREEIAQVLQGNKFRVYLEDEPLHYYWGRVFFKDWKSEASYSKVVFEYKLDPYKYDSSTDEEAGL